MKITEKQLQMLYQIALDSGSLEDPKHMIFKFNIDTRRRLINDIINQQSDELINTKEL